MSLGRDGSVSLLNQKTSDLRSDLNLPEGELRTESERLVEADVDIEVYKRVIAG